jgi:RNA recognition motif-containing protein
MTVPVGEDSWIDFIDQKLRKAADLEARVAVLEQFRRAVFAEPGSIKVWTAYCEYFWSLYTDCQAGSDAGWSRDDQMLGRETFTLDAALHLWQEAYDAVLYRLSDSHELWNRWISLELEQLAKTRMEQGVRRITHLFKNRLAIPHSTWDDTSQMFSSFLSEYNRNAYESEMQQVTRNAADAKHRYELRDSFEMKLKQAARAGDIDAQKTALSHYLDWEMKQCKIKRDDAVSVEICLGLYSRALTGLMASDESTWINYIVFLSSTRSDISSGRVKSSAERMTQVLPNMLDTFQRAVHHIPWSGTIWSRYILGGEEAELSFADIERIKHAATSNSQLDRDGMTGVLEMYSAWCGYLKRRAVNPNASEEAIDIADIGLPAALEDVQHWGKRRYGNSYKGDPNYRLEKIYIQYLTEKRETPDEARHLWDRLSRNDLLANSYDFWLNYYLWEMVVFSAARNKGRSPTPSNQPRSHRIPSLATQVFIRALQQRNLDWPERVMEVYLQHCNDYEIPDTLRQALDTVHKTRRAVARRREREAAANQAAYAAAAQTAPVEPQPEQAEEESMADATTDESPTGKRKRETGQEEGESASKRPKSELVNGVAPATESSEEQQQSLKRDRENTSVFVSRLPADITQTKIKQYFREYGHINNIELKKGDEDMIALVEFRAPEEAQSALLRDGKFFGQDQISVKAASGCTLFVTNYPPEADDEYIRNLFKSCGDIFSVRFPSLKFNTKRRFCYVTFYEAGSAAKATRLEGKLLDGKFKLQAKYSDPLGKQQRSGAQAEEREVHILNLHPDANEDELKTMFAKHGNAQSVRILRNMGGASHGTAFVVMETKEQARAAIEALDKLAFRSRVLTVELSKPKNFKATATSRATPTGSPSPAPSGPHDHDDDGKKPTNHISAAEIEARKIAVLGIPDTMTDARVRAALEPVVGSDVIAKLVLHPGRGGAVLEFADAGAAGRAAMAIEGVEIDTGIKVSVAKTLGELFGDKKKTSDKDTTKPSGKSAASLMPPPATVIRRPAMAGRGGKRGLGFVGAVAAAKKGPNGHGTTTTNGGSGTAPAKKSNADFKAMFLSSSKPTTDETPKAAVDETK